MTKNQFIEILISVAQSVPDYNIRKEVLENKFIQIGLSKESGYKSIYYYYNQVIEAKNGRESIFKYSFIESQNSHCIIDNSLPFKILVKFSDKAFTNLAPLFEPKSKQLQIKLTDEQELKKIEPNIKSEKAGVNMTAVQKISKEISFFLSKIDNFPNEEEIFCGTIDDDWQNECNFIFRENIWELTDSCFLELDNEEFERFMTRILKSLDKAKFSFKRGCLLYEDLKDRYPNENFEIIENQKITLAVTKTALKLFFSSKLEEYKTETKETPTNQLKTKLTDTQRGKLFELLVSGGFITDTTNREGFIWAFGGVNNEYTSISIEWLKAKNLAVYLIDEVCIDNGNLWAIGKRIFNIGNMAQIKQGYFSVNKMGKPKGFELIDDIITEAQK
jgi:hypothetical protein